MSTAHHGAPDRAPAAEDLDEKELEVEAERARRHALAELVHLFPELTGAEPDADGHREPDWEAVRDALRELSPEELRDALTGGPMRPPHEPAHLAAPAAEVGELRHPGDDDGTAVTELGGDASALDYPGDRTSDSLADPARDRHPAHFPACPARPDTPPAHRFAGRTGRARA